MVRFSVMKHGTNLFWQLILILLAVLAALWCATEWTVWSPRLGEPLFIILDMPAHPRRAPFGMHFSFHTYATDAFKRERLTEASGGVAAMAFAMRGISFGARRARGEDLYNTGALDSHDTFRDLMKGVQEIAAPRNPPFTVLLIRHIGQKVYCAC